MANTSTHIPDAENQRVAWIGLWLSIAGLVVPVVLALICRLVSEKDVAVLCLVLFGAMEVGALGCGIVARRLRAGKAALVISAVSLVLVALVVSVFVPFRVIESHNQEEGQIQQGFGQ